MSVILLNKAFSKYTSKRTVHPALVILSCIHKETKKSCVYQLTGMFSDASSSGQSWFSLLADSSQQLLDFSNGSSGIEALGTSLSAVHNGVTSVHGEGISQLVQSFSRLLISRIYHPSVSLHKHSRSEILVTIPPV